MQGNNPYLGGALISWVFYSAYLTLSTISPMLQRHNSDYTKPCNKLHELLYILYHHA